jgi:hypothetical protein
MGPSGPDPGEVREATASVLRLLKERGLLAPPLRMPAPMLAARRRAVLRLMEAVQGILWQDACENF